LNKNLLELILGGCILLCVDSKAVGEVDATISYTRRTALSLAGVDSGAWWRYRRVSGTFPHPFAGTTLY
jgi:hypothetical protein